mgnify:CR=1 FL=1
MTARLRLPDGAAKEPNPPIEGAGVAKKEVVLPSEDRELPEASTPQKEKPEAADAVAVVCAGVWLKVKDGAEAVVPGCQPNIPVAPVLPNIEDEALPPKEPKLSCCICGILLLRR